MGLRTIHDSLPGCRDDEAVWYAGADENLLMRRQTGELVAEDVTA
jgi:hypothetical protein